jgi:hypothetical protein
MKHVPDDPLPQNYQLEDIDQYRLDEEWIRQDKLVGYYGEEMAKARRKWEEAKTAVKLFEVETARRVRRKPRNFGVARLTESAIKEVVAAEVLTSVVHDKLISAQYKMELLEVVLRRLEHRKRALTDLVYLHGQSYFATPTFPKNERMRDRVNKKKDGLVRGLRRKDHDE